MWKALEFLRCVFNTRNLLAYARISATNKFDSYRLDVQIDRVRIIWILSLLHTHNNSIILWRHAVNIGHTFIL
jgi:hypothetical protein